MSKYFQLSKTMLLAVQSVDKVPSFRNGGPQQNIQIISKLCNIQHLLNIKPLEYSHQLLPSYSMTIMYIQLKSLPEYFHCFPLVIPRVGLSVCILQRSSPVHTATADMFIVTCK